MPRRPIARGSARHAIHPSHAAFTGKSSQRNKIQKANFKKKVGGSSFHRKLYYICILNSVIKLLEKINIMGPG